MTKQQIIEKLVNGEPVSVDGIDPRVINELRADGYAALRFVGGRTCIVALDGNPILHNRPNNEPVIAVS